MTLMFPVVNGDPAHWADGFRCDARALLPSFAALMDYLLLAFSRYRPAQMPL
ncbi:hypothetical protein [Hafnia alvei]|uniref:hypothetical protein n=1 Tax=Hafnia alvei TaxID=569 RepID=UPI00187D5909|nr:hypothetical protein [Hafnia alvei]